MQPKSEKGVEMDFNKIFKYSWDLFVRDIVPLLVGGLIASILTVVSLGILAGPLYGGLTKMVIKRVRDKKAPEIGDIFSAMDQFIILFITTLVLVLLIGLGLFLCIVPGVLLATIWMYVLVYIVDKRVSMGEAMSRSKALVSQVGFGMHLVMVIVCGVILGILGMTYIGGFVAGTFIIVIICVMYFLSNNEEYLLVDKPSAGVFEVKVQNNIRSEVEFSIHQSDKHKNVDMSPVVASPPVQTQADREASERKSVVLLCLNCGKKATQGSFCVECGAPLKVVCPNCSKELVSTARFCPACGSKLV
ncbi:MAG: zinc ribbon domain-containing protein [Deltaproteobacteria bacterium]|nr:zinc ribbon domain-containing protein [Deltaproteobacteria bacterium]